MGACVRKSSTGSTAIVLARRGKIIVTHTDLIYIGSRNEQKWEWPLTSLRCYRYEGKIFSFTPAQNCSSGEGPYIFVCDKAKELFDLVAMNISQESWIGEAAAVGPGNKDAQPQQMLSSPKASPLPSRFEYTSILFSDGDHPPPDADHPPPDPDTQERHPQRTDI